MIALLIAAAVSSAAAQLPCDAREITAARETQRLLLLCKNSPDLFVVAGSTSATLGHLALPDAPATDRNIQAISDDGGSVAVGSRDGTILIWHLATNSVVRWKAPLYANSLKFTPDGKRLFVDGRAIDGDTAAPSQVSLAGGFDAPNDIAYARDGRTGYVAEADTTVRAFDLASGKETARFSDSLVEPLAIGVDPSAGNVVVSFADGGVELLSSDLHRVRAFAAPKGTLVGAIMAMRGKALVGALPADGGAAPKAMILDLTSGQWTSAPDFDDVVTVTRTGTQLIGYSLNHGKLDIKRLNLSR